MSEQFPRPREQQKEFGIVERDENMLYVNPIGSAEMVAKARFEKKNLPVPYYDFHSFNTKPSEQGKGFGSHILAEAERISLSENVPIVLSDDVNPEQNSDAVGMYGKRPGWIEIPADRTAYGHRMYVFGDRGNPDVVALIEKFSPKT